MEEENVMEEAKDIRKESIFSNQVIMRTFLALLPQHEVLKCRLLSYAANDEACSLLNLNPDGNRCKHFRNSSQAYSFVSAIKGRIPALPFLKYQAFGFTLKNIPPQILADFANLLGSEIQSLSLDIDPSSTQKVSQVLMPATYLTTLILYKDLELGNAIFPVTFPYLEELEFYSIEIGNSLVRYILGRAPRLQHIYVRAGDSIFEELPKLLYDACPLRPPPAVTIGRGPFEAELLTFCLNELTSKGYSGLRKLEIHPICYDYFPAIDLLISVRKFLKLNGNCTKSVTFEYSVSPSILVHGVPKFSLPRMSQLMELNLFLPSGFRTCPLRPFVADQFPVLQQISIGPHKDTPYRADWLLFPESLVIPTLQKLEMNAYVGNADKETWHKSFPNLKHLSITDFPSVSFMRYVLVHMTFLENIEIGWSRKYWNYSNEVNGEDGLWEIYTGGVNKVSTAELLKLFKLPLKNELESTENREAIPVASFANMRRLVSLQLFIGSKTEYEAMAFMSAKGLLPKLTYLSFKMYADPKHKYDKMTGDNLANAPNNLIVDERLENAFKARQNFFYFRLH